MLDLLINAFTANGYAAVFIVLLACGLGVPIPEDLSLIAGGVIAGLGYANVHTMFGVGVLGVLAGDSAIFLLGRHLGVRAIRKPWVARMLKPKRQARVQKYFARFGKRLMFVARFLPGLRAPIYLTAGMSRQVPFHQFFMLDGLAALISVPVWVYLGFYGAVNHDWLVLWIKRSKIGISVVLAAVIVLLVIWFWRRRHRKRQRLQRLRAVRRRKGR